MRALALACLLGLALADIDISVDILVPVGAGLNLTLFAQNLNSWNPPSNTTNTTGNSTNTTGNSTAPVKKGFFAPFNLRVALAGLNNVLCVTGLNMAQCYTDSPQETPAPPQPTPAPPAEEGMSPPLIFAISVSSGSLFVLLAMAVFLFTKRKLATRLVMRCIIRETIDLPTQKNVSHWQRAPAHPNRTQACP